MGVFPYLHFRVWNLPWYTEQDRLLGQDRRAHDGLGGEREGRVAAGDGDRVFVPLADLLEAKCRLMTLNQQAILARLDGWFFCAKCQQAHKEDWLADHITAEWRCRGCADEEFMRRAAEDRKLYGSLD